MDTCLLRDPWEGALTAPLYSRRDWVFIPLAEAAGGDLITDQPRVVKQPSWIRAPVGTPVTVRLATHPGCGEPKGARAREAQAGPGGRHTDGLRA